MSARMFHTLVVVGASIASGCGPKIATDDDAGDEGSSSAGSSSASSATTGPGTSAGTSVGTTVTTVSTDATSVTTTGPDTATSAAEVGPASDTCPSGDGCSLDVPAPKFDLPAGAGPYECCFSQPCEDGLLCDPSWSFCTAYCMDPVVDCPPAPLDDAQPACVDTGSGPVCVLDCSNGETCPPGYECTLWVGMQAVCSLQCVIPIG